MAFYSPLSVCESSAATNDTIPARFFGMHTISVLPSQPYGLFRTWDDCYAAGGYVGNKTWQFMEPSKGNYDWRAMDDLVNALKPQGVDILFCFGGTPSWAASAHTAPPTNIQDWDDFVTAFVNRYHTRVKYLEVWNEAMAQEGFYTGTIPQLVQLAQHLYTITKSIDPTVSVLTPDATGGSHNMGKFYSDYFAAGGGAYADVIAFHGYCSMAGAKQITFPEEIIGIVTALKGAMNSYGQGSKPIFCTEGDWGSTNNAPTSDDRVAFLARHYLLQWSLGVSSYAWYCWDNNNGTDQWGQLWTPSGGLNVAGIAYQQLYNWMVGATMTQPCAAQGSVGTCGFSRPGGYQALAVWNTNRAAASTFTVPNGYVQYRDLAGNLHSISGTTVTIGIKPILLENSNPVTPISH
jgi:Beta-galactosidase